MSRPPSSRTDPPAYLLRYRERRAAAGLPAPDEQAAAPASFVERALARSGGRARADKARADAPPGGVTADYAAETVSPREIVPTPEVYDQHLGGSVEVRFIRHGQTQGYATDAGLSPLGRWQAHRKGQDLARGCRPGLTVRIPHADTARARETARSLREGLCEGIARFGIEGVTVEEPHANRLFDNFQVWCDGRELDCTAAFMDYATLLEKYEREQGGKRPGWLVEMDRFWSIQAAGDDPITHWLRMPMQYFEPAALCVRRFWRGALDEVARGPGDLRVLVCTHSGPIRAVATSAVGHDPGEPTNLEDVRLRVLRGRQRAVVTYRGRGLEIEIPSTRTPSWMPDAPR